jgi:hypothetical protein
VEANEETLHEELTKEEMEETAEESFSEVKDDRVDEPKEEKTEETPTEEPVVEEEPTETPVEEEAVVEETTEDIIGGLKTDLSEKEIQRRILQSERDTYKEIVSQQPEAPKETLPKYKTVPLENLSPQDFMQEEYFPDEAGTKGTASHRAMQEYHREVADRSYAEAAQRGKAKTDDEAYTADYNKFVKSINGDKDKLAIAEEAARMLSSTNPNEFVGWDNIYKFGLMMRGELSDKTKETVQKITEHKAKLKEQPAAPFDKPNQRGEELSDEKELSKQEDDDLDEMLGKKKEPFLS